MDDEVFVRKGLQKLIRWEQHHFTIIGEGRYGGEALTMIQSLEPDLVITDIMMPVLDGLGLILSVKVLSIGTTFVKSMMGSRNLEIKAVA